MHVCDTLNVPIPSTTCIWYMYMVHVLAILPTGTYSVVTMYMYILSLILCYFMNEY